MYTFYYDHLKAKYGNRCTLLFTDADSLCCHIQTPNLYEDMDVDLTEYDTSNFEKDHPLYSTKNYRVLGKFNSDGFSRTQRVRRVEGENVLLGLWKEVTAKGKGRKETRCKKERPPLGLSGSFKTGKKEYRGRI